MLFSWKTVKIIPWLVVKPGYSEYFSKDSSMCRTSWTGNDIFRMNCLTLTSPWSANGKVKKLFDIESEEQQCLFSSVVWCWVELSHTDDPWVPAVLRKQCQEGRGLKDNISLKMWFFSLGGSMCSAGVLHLAPPHFPMPWRWYPARFWSIVPTCSLSSAWWPCGRDRAVARSWAELMSSRSLPYTQRTWYQTEVLASGHPPPGTWAVRSDTCFTMWEDNAPPGVLEKQIFRRCAAVGGDNEEEELRIDSSAVYRAWE